eukprot:740100-Prymnesium_polylepis.1
MGSSRRSDAGLEVTEQPPAPYSGWLRKQNPHGKYQDRWCVLKCDDCRGTLSYYTSANFATVPNGVIDLDGLQDITDLTQWEFKLVCTDRTYPFAAATSPEALAWVEALQAAKQWLVEREQKVEVRLLKKTEEDRIGVAFTQNATGLLRVINLVEDGLAAAAGIRVRDRLLAIDGQ